MMHIDLDLAFTNDEAEPKDWDYQIQWRFIILPGFT